MNVDEATRQARARAGLNLTARLLGQIEALDAEERISRDPEKRALILAARERAKVDALQHLAAYRNLNAAIGLYRIVEPLRVQLAIDSAPPTVPTIAMVNEPDPFANLESIVAAALAADSNEVPWSVDEVQAILEGAI